MTTPPADPRLRALYLAAKRRAFLKRRMEMMATIGKALEPVKRKK